MSGDPFRRLLQMRGMLRVVHDFFGTGGITPPDCLMSELAVFSLKMPFLLQFDRRVCRGEDPVQARIIYPWNRLQELGEEDNIGLIRSGPQPFRPRSNDSANTPHGNERAGRFIRPDRKSCPPRTVGPFRAPRTFVGPPTTKLAGIAAFLGSGHSMS